MDDAEKAKWDDFDADTDTDNGVTGAKAVDGATVTAIIADAAKNVTILEGFMTIMSFGFR